MATKQLGVNMRAWTSVGTIGATDTLPMLRGALWESRAERPASVVELSSLAFDSALSFVGHQQKRLSLTSSSSSASALGRAFKSLSSFGNWPPPWGSRLGHGGGDWNRPAPWRGYRLRRQPCTQSEAKYARAL